MSSAQICIESWHNEISVARNHPDPLRVRDHIDKLTRHAPIALERALDAYLQRHGGAVILVRSLDLNMELDTDCDIEQASRVLAKHVTHRLVEQIESAAPSVVRFESEAAYRARFIADLANGRAWGQWYYEGFEGLQMLPTSCAIRSALLEDPDLGRATLAAIPAETWPAIASVLDDADAVRIVDGLVDLAADFDGIRLFDELAQIAARSPRTHGLSATRLALTLIAALHRGGLPCTPALIQASEVVASLLVARRSNGHASIRALTEPSGHRTCPSVFQCVPAHFRVLHHDALRELISNVLKEMNAHQDSTDEFMPLESYDTPFAGFIVLLGSLPDHDDAAAALAILCGIAGPGREELFWNDAAWRSMLRVDCDLTWGEFSQAFAHLAAESEAVVRRFARRIPGMSDASTAYIRANLLAAHGRCDRLEVNRYHLRIKRPPLHVLLALTGLSRGSLAWRGGEETVIIDVEYL